MRHVLFVVVAAPFIAWNLKQVDSLSGGKAAPSELVPTCCGKITRRLRPAAQWIYDRVGNPFEFPASAWFAIEHDVPMSRWDQTVGNYPLVPGIADLSDTRYAKLRGSWDVGSDELRPYLLGNWSKPEHVDKEKPFRHILGDSARILVPNLIPDAQRATLWISASAPTPVAVEWNDRLVTAGVVGRWTSLEFVVPDGDLHMNELRIIGSGIRVRALEVSVLGAPSQSLRSR